MSLYKKSCQPFQTVRFLDLRVRQHSTHLIDNPFVSDYTPSYTPNRQATWAHWRTTTDFENMKTAVFSRHNGHLTTVKNR